MDKKKERMEIDELWKKWKKNEIWNARVGKKEVQKCEREWEDKKREREEGKEKL